MSEHELSLQEKYAPDNACFGCGPANPEGLKIQSYPRGDEVVASFRPQKKYEAFPGVLNGGIVGALLDCHSNWTAAWYLMQQSGESLPPCTVTAEYTIKLRRPTPTDGLLELSAKVKSASKDRATIEAKLMANGKICATCEGIFVAVKPGHPGYYRW